MRRAEKALHRPIRRALCRRRRGRHGAGRASRASSLRTSSRCARRVRGPAQGPDGPDARAKETLADIESNASPDILVTIDSWGFTGRIHQRLARAKATPIPRVRYVAPQVWAWRPGRAKQLARWIDHLLTLLPFEPPYFSRHGTAGHLGGPSGDRERLWNRR